MMKNNIVLGLLLTAGLLLSGCATVSNAPGVTQTSADGEYLSIVNKQTAFMGYLISNRNVVVRCNAKAKTCDTLNLWTPEGDRIF